MFFLAGAILSFVAGKRQKTILTNVNDRYN